MKIQHITEKWVCGGIESLIVDLCAATSRQGVENDVVYLYEEETRGKPVAPFSATGVGMLARFRLDPAGLLRLRRVIRKRQPDVLHCHSYYSAAAALALRATGLRVPILYTVHANLIRGVQRSDALVERVLRSCDSIAAVSWKTAESVERYFRGTRSIPVITNGIDFARVELPAKFCREAKRQSVGITKGTNVYCTVATLTKQKDHPTLFRSFAKLLRSGDRAVLLIVGTGEDRDVLESLARELNIYEQVRFLGKRDDVAEWLAVSHVFVLASHGEGMPISIVEACCSGLPVVATDVGGIGDFAKMGVDIRLTRHADIEDLSAALHEAVAANSVGDVDGRKARARSVFSIDNTAERYRNSYSKLVSTSSWLVRHE